MLQGLKTMKKIILLLAPLFAACGDDTKTADFNFAAEEVSISKTAVCENLDAAIIEDLDAGTVNELCGYEKVCTDFETELVCEGEWCVTHRFCRMD